MKIFSNTCKLYSSVVRSCAVSAISPAFSTLNLNYSTKMPFYAVAKGVVPGVYTEWSECQKQTTGFKGPQFKKFSTREEAEQFIAEKSGNVIDKRKKETTTAAAAAGDKKKEASSGKSSSGGGEESSNGESKGKKRARSPEGGDDSSEADTAPSGIKKRVLERAAPDGKHFEVDDSGNVIVYTDGCCEFNGKHGAKAGIGVYFGEDNPLNLSEPVRGRATNNTAEIQAITYALELIKRAGFSQAIINTDSQFVINCITSWMSGWKKRGWKKSDGSAVINKEDLIDLDKAGDGLMVKYTHVKAHSGIEGNEMADKLAKAGSKKYDATVTE